MTIFNGTVDTPGDFDRLYVYMTVGQTYYFELEGSATGQGTLADPTLAIRVYPYDVIVAQDDDGGAGRNSRIVFTAQQSAWYELDMGGFGSSTGTFRLNFNQDDFRDTPEGVGTAGFLGTGGTINGNINFAGDRDVHAITLIAGQTYHFELQGSPSGFGTLADSYLRLLSDLPGVGTVLAADDDGGWGLDSRLVYTATTTGTYYLQAGEFGDDSTGSYRIFAHADEYRDTFEGTGAVGLIDTGATRTASLQLAGDTDFWSTTLISGLTYTIEERGSPSGAGTLADPYLVLRDVAGNTITLDDDSGTGFDSLISFTATTTDTHFIEAGSLNDAYAGTYTLALSVGRATAANNSVTGTTAVDAIDGLGGADALNGLGGNDWLAGGTGADTIRGGAQNDLLSGGTEADILIGGAGADRFDFNMAADSTPTARDILRAGDGGLAFDGAGAAAGDRIDLAGMDADALTATNDAFIFGGTGRGRIWLTESGTNTILNANNDNDAAAEFQVVIEDAGVRSSAYSAADFIL